ncbi:MAG: GNAT family N-acetyltransferase [Anaerolineaceae bacterium]|nr:GNAT family N-acetyltransferase [Anaerolineaceae bacterium]
MTKPPELTIPTIKTERLFLRAWSMDNAEMLFQILQEKDILQYFPNPNPPSVDRVQRYIAHQLAHWQEYGYGHWAVVSQETKEVLGWVGLEYLTDVKETEVAYLLTRRVWGKGLATEAAQAAVRFGRENAGLRKIIGLVHPENTGSARVLQKCGLKYEQKVPLWGMDLEWYQVEY